MKTYTERLLYAIELRDENQTTVANAIGVKPQAIQHLCDKNKSVKGSRHTAAIAEFLRVPARWLEKGVGPAPGMSDVAPGPDVQRMIPLISWIRAGEFEDAVDNLMPGEAEDWYPLPKKAGPNTYCLRVEGESMQAPHGRSYPPGCIIFVDPDKRLADNGTRIVAKMKGNSQVTFKALVKEGDRVWLRPLNPQHPPIFEPFKVIGTVIGKWEDE